VELEEGGLSVSFAAPEWLLLLLLVPLLAVVARFSRRQLGRSRWWLAQLLRAALVASVALALAEPTLRRPVDDLAVVYVVDGSASVGADGAARALQFVRDSLAHAQHNDRAGVVVFGADAMVEREVAPDLAVHTLEARPNPHQSDLAAGLRLGTALLPADRTRRVVLLTDGEETRGDAAGQALLAASDDLEIAVVPLGSDQRPEALIEDLIAPPIVDEGAAYEVRVVARAETDTQGVLRLYENDRYLGEMPVTLPAQRSQVLSFRREARDAGLVRFRAQLEVAGSADAQPENNVGVATVSVRGRPKILLVERDAGQAQHLASVFEKQGLVVDTTDAGGMPPDLTGLRPYAAVFLSDVPSYAMSLRTQEALEVYVRDLGRGLVMLGGDESFGVGGWYRTPVERALPVRMDLSDKARFPKLAMVLALDKSCSMGDGAGSALGMAKEAAIRTAELLSDRDSLGLVSFDGASSWISPLAPLGSRRQQVLDNIAAIRSGGGTDIYPAVDAANQALRSSDAAMKHIVLISDGMTQAGDFETLIGTAHRQDQITLTAVAIGDGADQQTMQSMSKWGGGQYYYVTDRTAIPAIFTREALLATRSFLIEEPFRPALASPSDLTRGLADAAFPRLGGYVATEAKQRSTTAMVVPGSEEGGSPDPLLVHWRYGLGRSVAFTSDAKARWASDWVGSESYVQLWTQVARWVVASGDSGGVGALAEIREGELVVTVDALDPAGGFRNFLEGEARVVAPDLTVHNLPLMQVGPGRYEARVPVDQDGSWLAGVQLSSGDEVVGQVVAEAVQPYSPEYRRHETGQALLTELGRLGGGGTLTDPAAVFARPETPRQVPRPLWPPLLALAAVLLLLDVASRRLDPWRDPVASAVTVPAAAQDAPRWRQVRPVSPVAGAPTAASGAAPEVLLPEVPDVPRVEVPEDSYAGRLLAARKAARKKMGD
jgi:Mg-chelatase subunit ChlD